MSDTKQAAERLRRCYHDAPYDIPYCKNSEMELYDLRTVFNAEHAADDDELITGDWLDETFGKRDSQWGEWKIGTLSVVHCFGWHVSRSEPMVTVNYITTRGQLRLLLRALGVTQ